MSATDKIREALEGIDRDDGMDGGWWETSVGVAFGTRVKVTILAALAELEAELARAWAAVKDEAEQTCIEIDLRRATEVELERLTVGRATLEDQTNRAELAEARVDALQAALRNALDCKGWGEGLVSKRGGPPAICTDCEESARAVLVLSGGSE